MHRKPELALLCAILLSAPACAGAQSIAASASPHPAASAHANAVAGQADAARIEACTHVAGALIDNLEKGNYKEAVAGFDATMQANLGADKLGEVWQGLGKQVGKLTGRGAPQNVMYQGLAIVTLPLRFEKSAINAQVACDADGKVAGFYLRPAEPQPSH